MLLIEELLDSHALGVVDHVVTYAWLVPCYWLLLKDDKVFNIYARCLMMTKTVGTMAGAASVDMLYMISCCCDDFLVLMTLLMCVRTHNTPSHFPQHAHENNNNNCNKPVHPNSTCITTKIWRPHLLMLLDNVGRWKTQWPPLQTQMPITNTIQKNKQQFSAKNPGKKTHTTSRGDACDAQIWCVLHLVHLYVSTTTVYASQHWHCSRWLCTPRVGATWR